jgi:CubicO group peptidase (beta-lactamase class C family)
MVIEADMGNYVGSSYGWATTRDWSKFGCCTCTKETGTDSRELGEICRNSCNVRGAYGAQFWLNAGGKFPCPRDMFYCSGFQGQMVAIIPSLDLVIVHGLKRRPDFDFNGFERSDWEFER